MNRLIRYIKENIGYLFRISMFAFLLLIIMFFFPRQGKFRYEFQKGSPWQHKDLIAEYNFPIYKTDGEIQLEKDEILSDFFPFFRLDKNKEVSQISSFYSKFEQIWNTQTEKGRVIDVSSKRAIKEKEKIYSFLSQKLSFVYYKGILDASNLEEEFVKGLKGLNIIRDNVVEETDKSEVFTLKSAYEYLNQQWISFHTENKFYYTKLGFSSKIGFDQFIVPNLIYDKETSIKEKDELLSSISLTQGMVQKGERIIFKGDIIDGQKYKVLESLKRAYETKMGMSASFYLIIIGQTLLVSIAILMLFLFINQFRRDILDNTNRTMFLLFIIALFIVITSYVVKSNYNFAIYLVPFAIVPIMVKTFYDARLALFVHIITIFLVGFYAPNSYEFIFISFFAGLVAIFSLSNLYRRGKLFFTAMLVVLSYSAIYFSLSIIQEATIENLDYTMFAWFAINGALILLAFPLTYLFEKSFGFLSEATLLELSDTNQPLLRQLAEKAPGTFQHSMQVANLAEEAIFRIGGNPLLIRTGALYHDIGKMLHPSYFVENQSPGFNPHDALEADDSAKIIIQHVYDGIHLAKKHKIPLQIIDFIRTHHGTTKVQYFYRTYKNKYPDKNVDSSKFTYPGPKPFSKETAVLMMADSVEAASRSLKDYSIKSIDDLVENIINYQQIEEQFNDADITFKDIQTIKKLYKEKLKNIYHARIEYPKENVKD